MNTTIAYSLPSSRLRHGLAATAMMVVVLLAGCSMHARMDTDRAANAIAKLTAKADAWDQAIVRKDRAAIEANMADDFRNIDSNGRLLTNSEFVDELVSPDIAINPYNVEDFDVRLFGDIALVSGRVMMAGRYKGEPFTSHFRYIDIYAKRGDEWKVISVQTTRIPKE